jgi:hypothetical protein
LGRIKIEQLTSLCRNPILVVGFFYFIFNLRKERIMNTIYLPKIFPKSVIKETSGRVFIDTSLAQEIRKVANQYSAKQPYKIFGVGARIERGLNMALDGKVILEPTATSPHRCKVISSDGVRSYLVDLNNKYCSCPDSQKGNHCKHRLASYFVLQAIANLEKEKAKQANEKTQSVKTIPTSPSKPFPIVERKDILETISKVATQNKVAEPIVAAVIQPTPPQPAVRLGSLFRKYLHGEDLIRPVQVSIEKLSQETVIPHPAKPPIQKWCLWVDGLPQGLPNGILFGPQGDRELTSIFGKVDIESLRGKKLEIYPQTITVAGQPRLAIRFRRAS